MFSYSGVMNMRLYEARKTVFVALRKYARPMRGWSWLSVSKRSLWSKRTPTFT